MTTQEAIFEAHQQAQAEPVKGGWADAVRKQRAGLPFRWPLQGHRKDFLLPELQQGLSEHELNELVTLPQLTVQEMLLFRGGRAVTVDSPITYDVGEVVKDVKALENAVARMGTGDIGAAMEVQERAGTLKERLSHLPSSEMKTLAESVILSAEMAMDKVRERKPLTLSGADMELGGGDDFTLRLLTGELGQGRGALIAA